MVDSFRSSVLSRTATKGRLISLLAVVLFPGCVPTGGSNPRPVASKTVASDSEPAISAFRWVEEGKVIWLDTQIAPPQRRRFDIGLGSITIETLAASEHQLTFRYTPEIEGGYTVYECTVPISDTPVTFEIAPDGTPGSTSFDLAKCKVIRKGNLHFDPERIDRSVNPKDGSDGL